MKKSSSKSYSFLDDEAPIVKDKCRPNPCAANAECKDGVCSCISDYIGNPYFGCHPECVLNTECTWNKACINQKCVDPCANMCGREALCSVINHIPMCDCPYGYTGNAYVACTKIESMSFLFSRKSYDQFQIKFWQKLFQDHRAMISKIDAPHRYVDKTVTVRL